MNRGNRKAILAISTLVLVILGMIVFTIKMTAKISQETEETTVYQDEGPIHFTGEVETLNGETIESGIREMGELVTAEYYYTHAEDFQNVKTLFGIKVGVTKSTLLYTVDGNIKAGIDFNAVIVDVDDETRTIKVHLPNSKIISSEIDHDSFKVVDEKEGWFNELSAEDVNKTFAHVKEMEEEKAVENGLLERADENAVRILTSFVKTGFDLLDYSIEVGK